MSKGDNLAAGARNMLINCAMLEPKETLLVVKEQSSLGWYDDEAPDAVIEGAKAMGTEPTVLHVGGPQSRISANVTKAVENHDCTIFFARIGDQDRFAELPPGCRSVMVYARDAAALSSPYGRIDHRAMVDVKRCVNELCANSDHIEITCELGTDLSGKPGTSGGAEEMLDVSVARFPMAVPAPVLASGFSGRVALSRYLTTTGSMPYEPAAVRIEGVVFAEVSNGRIDRFSGSSDMVARIVRHYDHVADLFGLDSSIVHSWHAGIHPACAYGDSIEDDPDRWSNNVFANPRFLHFHTCGSYAPGEICWMVLDPTISLDGINLWQNGRLCLSHFDLGAACIDKWPALRNLLDQPEMRVGLDDRSGRI